MRAWSLPTVPAKTIPMTYAGSTASLSDHAASEPNPNNISRRYFASSSEGRLPYFLKNQGVTYGNTAKTTTLTTMNITVFMVKGAKIRPRAMTVPRSVIKQAARIVFPNSVLFRPSSSITAYTTATDVVDIATPASQLDL